MALVTTVAGASSDSYASVAEADALLGWRDSDAWENAEDATKEAVLKAAARYMDRNLYWRGAKADSDQAMRFPSEYHVDSSGDFVIPERIKEAQAVFAMRLLEDPDLMSGGGTVKQVGVPGGFNVTFGGESGTSGSGVPDEVLAMVDQDLWKSGPNYTQWDSARRGWV